MTTMTTNAQPSAKVVLDFARDEFYIDQSPYWQPMDDLGPGPEEARLQREAWVRAVEGADIAGFTPHDPEEVPEEEQQDGTIRWYLYGPQRADLGSIVGNRRSIDPTQ